MCMLGRVEKVFVADPLESPVPQEEPKEQPEPENEPVKVPVEPVGVPAAA